MNYRQLLVVLAIALGVGGCASTTSNYQSSVRYENGSYYSPAEAGYGDYYFAPEPRNDYYDDPFFGSSFYAFGGYCPAVYGYCSPFWYDPFWGPIGYPSPYFGYHHHHRSHADDNPDARSSSTHVDDADDADNSTAMDDTDRRRPTRGRIGGQRQEVERREIRMSERPWPNAPAARESSDSGSGQGRRSRRGGG